MRVIVSRSPEIALRTMSDDDRRRVTAWWDHLANWESDRFVRDRSHRLSTDESVYVLDTSTDIRIFFTIEADRIIVLDIAQTRALESFSRSTGSDRL
jgi:hypothetical protein